MKNTVSRIRDQVAGLPLNDRIRLIQSLVQDFTQKEEIEGFEELDQVAAILQERLAGPSEVVENVGSWTGAIRERFETKTHDLINSSRHG